MKAPIIAVPDYGSQPVDVSRSHPARRRDRAGAHRRPEREQGRFAGVEGDHIRIVGVGDRTAFAAVSPVSPATSMAPDGRGRRLVVLYSTPARLRTRRRPRLQLARVPARRPEQGGRRPNGRRRRGYLRANTSFARFSDLPRSASPGPTRARTFRPARLADERVHGAGAAGGGVLMANTMGTLIGEQRREIGMMKAIGGTRRQIRRVYLLTALLLGGIAAVLGVGLGLVVANAIVRFFGSSSSRSRPASRSRCRSWSRAWPSVCSARRSWRCRRSGAARASPYGRRSRRCRRCEGGAGGVDRALRRLSFLPRTAQIGVRSITRRGGAA